jgi:hypothetical protein
MKKGFGLLGILVIGSFGTTLAPPPVVAQETQAQGSASASAQASPKQAQAPGNAAAAANASGQAGQASAALASGTAMNAALNTPVDSKKAKPGDSVTAHTTEAVKADGKTVIPKGTKLVGHVTQALTKAEGESQSTLGVVFDRAILKNGQEVPINAGIQALAAAQTVSSVGGSDLDTIGSTGASGGGSAAAGGRGALGAAGATAGGAVSGVTNTATRTTSGAVGAATGTTASVAGASQGAVGGLNAAGQLTSNSRGVFGLNGLSLNSSASNDTQGSLITSTGKNVHLASGTQMVLVTGAGSGGAAQSEPKKTDGTKRPGGTEPKQEQKTPPQTR